MQKAMDARCDVYDASPDPLVFPPSDCPQLQTQETMKANTCTQSQIAKEELDECESSGSDSDEPVLIEWLQGFQHFREICRSLIKLPLSSECEKLATRKLDSSR